MASTGVASGGRPWGPEKGLHSKHRDSFCRRRPPHSWGLVPAVLAPRFFFFFFDFPLGLLLPLHTGPAGPLPHRTWPGWPCRAGVSAVMPPAHGVHTSSDPGAPLEGRSLGAAYSGTGRRHLRLGWAGPGPPRWFPPPGPLPSAHHPPTLCTLSQLVSGPRASLLVRFVRCQVPHGCTAAVAKQVGWCQKVCGLLAPGGVVSPVSMGGGAENV